MVLCGSFRRDPEGLGDAHRRLAASGASILSPVDLDFVVERNGFVFAAHEVEESPTAIEQRHLEAMQRADFVWLHAPDGYVGASASMELGFAHALGLAVYASGAPEDRVLGETVRVVAGPEEAVEDCTPERMAADAPTRALTALQQYYRRAAQLRGWADETVSEALLLLTEEVGELSRALRKTQNLRVSLPGEDPALELADVALYVTHLANILDIDLGQAVAAKERINAQRFEARAAPRAA